MKKRILIACFLVQGAIYAQINKDVYVQPEKAKEKPELISSVPYNVKEIKEQMKSGKSTIKGVMHAKPRNSTSGKKVIGSITGPTLAKNKPVYLIPYSDYVKDYIRLKHKSEKPKKGIYAQLHQEVFDLRYEALTNSKGEFTFPNLKPGIYYIFGEVNTATLTKNNYYKNGTVATNAYGQVVATGYDSYKTYKSFIDYVDNIVEIKEDGTVVDAVISDQKKNYSPQLEAVLK